MIYNHKVLIIKDVIIFKVRLKLSLLNFYSLLNFQNDSII